MLAITADPDIRKLSMRNVLDAITTHSRPAITRTVDLMHRAIVHNTSLSLLWLVRYVEGTKLILATADGQKGLST